MSSSLSCDLCGGCASVCPADAIRITSVSRHIDEKLCIKCGACQRVCPIDTHIKYDEDCKINDTPISKEFDVVVIGAGPAGIVTSLYAAAKGAKVLLVDRKAKIGSPLRCAEALLEYSFKMAGLALPNIPFEWMRSRFVGVNIFKENHNFLVPSGGFLVNREIMEKNMLADALSYGVELLLDTTVLKIEENKVFWDKGYVTTKIIVGADGVDSRIGRMAGLSDKIDPKDMASCIQYTLSNIEAVPNILQMHFAPKYSDGHAWIFPYGIKHANAGLYIKNKKEEKLRELLDDFISIFPRAKINSVTIGCIPVCKPLNKVIKDNIVLVGSAARQVFANNGAGLGNAMVFGKKAGETIGDMIIKSKPLDYLEIYQDFYENYIDIFNKFGNYSGDIN